jgi:hypothetical protein
MLKRSGDNEDDVESTEYFGEEVGKRDTHAGEMIEIALMRCETPDRIDEVAQEMFAKCRNMKS